MLISHTTVYFVDDRLGTTDIIQGRAPLQHLPFGLLWAVTTSCHRSSRQSQISVPRSLEPHQGLFSTDLFHRAPKTSESESYAQWTGSDLLKEETQLSERYAGRRAAVRHKRCSRWDSQSCNVSPPGKWFIMTAALLVTGGENPLSTVPGGNGRQWATASHLENGPWPGNRGWHMVFSVTRGRERPATRSTWTVCSLIHGERDVSQLCDDKRRARPSLIQMSPPQRQMRCVPTKWERMRKENSA